MARNVFEKRPKKTKNRASKVHLVFDEAKRREFLTGFRKRKLQRKKQAQEKLERELKEERKRLKVEARESYKNLVVSHRPIPELENLLNEEYEEGDVTVKVVELSPDEIAKQNHWIGSNKLKYEDEDASNDNEDQESVKTEIPGMELKPLAKKQTVKKQFVSEKQLKKELKKQATKNVKKSKVFQKKNNIERLKQKKMSNKLKQQNTKDKKGKKRGRNKRNVN
ncbi:nucleolar protein 12 [Cylas formicarius]|uniref:nucleolar protein 12 n=1 Tax=Cylas formicarius TaxID=197179 RepID=UPI0029587D31|nr:nucleolar protein 12 [Cylas formicarius]